MIDKDFDETMYEFGEIDPSELTDSWKYTNRMSITLGWTYNKCHTEEVGV